MRGLADDLRADVRYAARGLLRSPAFAAAAVLTLALAMGATTAILSVVDVVLLRPLPYADAHRLHSVWGVRGTASRIQPSYPDFLDWREGSEALDLAFARGGGFLYRGPELTENVLGAMVSEGFFDVLGARPALGRSFAPEEERSGGAPVVVLSHGLWTRRFGGDPQVVGRDIVLHDIRYTVVGVMPPGVAFPEWAEMWLPLAAAGAGDATLAERAHRVDNRALARLREGATPAAATAELDALASRLATLHPETNRELGLRLVPLREEVVGDVRAPLLVMLASAALVLLIACANLANLLLARATGRAREMAVRKALGARSGRVVRQLLTESVVLALAGGALGVLMARLLLDALVGLGPGELPALGLDLPYLAAVGLDLRVLALAGAATALTGLPFGAAPAVLAAGEAPAARLRGGAGSASGAGGARLQAALVAGQLALAVTLLGGAGLLLRSHWALSRTDPGFRHADLVILRVLPPERYRPGEERGALYQTIAERTEGLPGVRAATLVNHMPLTGTMLFAQVRLPDSPAPDDRFQAAYRTVARDFFEVTGMPVVRGRSFTPGDQAPGSGSMVVDDALASVLWPGHDPLGRPLTVRNPTPGSPRFGEEIQGVVVGVVRAAPRRIGAPVVPAVYLPHRWDPWVNMYLVLRAEGDPAEIVASVRSAVLEIDEGIPVADVTPMRHVIRDSLAREAFQARLMLALAALATVLGLVGVYGVLSHLVARRTREIGIRMAMGADAARVRRLVLGHAARLVAVGVGLGVAGAYVLGRLMEGMLLGVTATDPLTFATVSVLLATAALLATWAPAARASRLEPAAVLRVD